MKSVSPLRYPGGKANLANFVKAVIAKNNLWGFDYAEPYCGGAGIALELLKLEMVSRVHINDVDPAINSFWHSVVHHNDEFCGLVEKAKLNIGQWRKQQEILQNPGNYSRIQVGFAAFYLNRANRSGILTAGPIGGYDQGGDWLMDARFNKVALLDRLRSISMFRDRICVYALDAAKFLSNTKWAPLKTLCYLDPPYVVQGKRLYRNYYGEADHRRIGKLVSALPFPWIVSYDDVDLIDDIYSAYRKIKYGIGYSANIRSKGREIMVFSPALRLPDLSTPLSVSEKAWRAQRIAA